MKRKEKKKNSSMSNKMCNSKKQKLLVLVKILWLISHSENLFVPLNSVGGLCIKVSASSGLSSSSPSLATSASSDSLNEPNVKVETTEMNGEDFFEQPNLGSAVAFQQELNPSTSTSVLNYFAKDNFLAAVFGRYLVGCLLGILHSIDLWVGVWPFDAKKGKLWSVALGIASCLTNIATYFITLAAPPSERFDIFHGVGGLACLSAYSFMLFYIHDRSRITPTTYTLLGNIMFAISFYSSFFFFPETLLEFYDTINTTTAAVIQGTLLLLCAGLCAGTLYLDCKPMRYEYKTIHLLLLHSAFDYLQRFLSCLLCVASVGSALSEQTPYIPPLLLLCIPFTAGGILGIFESISPEERGRESILTQIRHMVYGMKPRSTSEA